ncbi:cilia- and flagella-associated protein 251 [Eucyclogobius newberryi]|uniref:cilia- and flagella-associated protein 251 n=1 Tax=Eucyclogobius newberryi TaxID=166745 RepID=UPI003B5B6A20
MTHARSDVFSATKDTLFSKNTGSTKTHALTLDWVYGRTPSLPVLALQDNDQQVALYAAENVAVIYNHTSNSQHILQGHSQNLCSLCVSDDRRWIATADPSPMILVWDSYSGIPVCSLFHGHSTHGFTHMTFSRDTKLLVTLGARDVQHVCVWDWTVNTETPLFCSDLNPNHGVQKNLVFNSSSSELLSCSRTHVLLHTLEQKSLSCFALRLRKGGAADPGLPGACHSMCTADGALVQAVFNWRQPQVLVATAGGSVVVWDRSQGVSQRITPDKVTLIHLQEAPFTVLTSTDRCLVTGDAEGQVKFLDHDLKLLALFSELQLEPITSISFPPESTAGFLMGGPKKEENKMFIRNFMVTSSGSSVLHVTSESEEAQTLLEEEPEPIRALCCHPTRPLLVTGNNCTLKLRDTSSRRTVRQRQFSPEDTISCVTYDCTGSLLALGFCSGSVHLLDSSSLQSDPEQGFTFSTDSIRLLSFSHDAQFLAAADSGLVVSVLRRVSELQWETLGRHRSHFSPIQSLMFGLQLDSAQPRLLSLGQDRRLVEYDLENSSGLGLSIVSSQRVEQRAVPLCMTWYPPLSTEQFLLLCSDQYKLRLLNSTTHMCRKVVLGPTYGSPLQQVLVLPKSSQDQSPNYYMAFITQDMVGLQLLPADGNPFKSQALVCHPCGASFLSASFDGGHVVSAGGAGFTAMSWGVSTEALEAAAALGGPDMEPFYTLLDGGRDGHFFREMEDVFYYIQVRQQGTDSDQTRQVCTTIPLNQVSAMMRAVGFFPSEQEIEELQNEVRFSRYAETGRYVTELDLEDFIKLYVNHRPVFGLREELEQSFSRLQGNQQNMQRSDLLQLLQSHGEAMTEDEVLQSFSSLLDLSEETDSSRATKSSIPSEMSLETLSQILGFPPASAQTPEP